MTDELYPRLVSFLSQLSEAGIHFQLASVRDVVMVQIAVPGQRWEVEFMLDGSVEVEKFISDGRILDELELATLLREFGD